MTRLLLSMTKSKRHIAKLNAALEADDFAYIKKQLPPLTSDNVVQMTFHKMRVESQRVSRSKRLASAFWLSERGLSRFSGGSPFDAIEEASA